MTENTEHQEEKYLEAGQAAQYLAEKWGRPSYNAEAFKKLRYRWNLRPAILTRNGSLWKKSDLDGIPEPERGRSRKKNRPNEDNEGETSSVILNRCSFSRAASLAAGA